MASLQLRSKSIQERKQQAMRRQLQKKFDWILNEKYPSNEPKTRERPPSTQERNHRYNYTKLHPSIQKVESIENMQLVGVKSAIQELQELATPTNRQEDPSDLKLDNPLEHKRRQQTKQQIPQSFKLEKHKGQAEKKDSLSRNKMEKQQNQTVQHYKEENQKLKTQLKFQTAKNQEFTAIIKKLEHNNAQLEREINLLLQKWQKEQTNASKINTLQQDFKQQLIINLQLEELLLKQRLQTEKKHASQHPKIEESFKNVIKELDQQLNETRKMAQREIQALKLIIQGKNKEIIQLKETISKQNNTIVAQGMTSLEQLQSPLNPANCNFMERFSNFSKEMEAKLSQNHIVSTNPSLQDTATIGLENRKHSQSQCSKGNCPSVQVPMLVMRENNHKGVSQTDRT